MSETGKRVFRLRQLVLAQAIWLLQVPALAAGIGEQPRDGKSHFQHPANDRMLAVRTQPAGSAAGHGQKNGLPNLLLQHGQPPPLILTLAQANSKPEFPADTPTAWVVVTGTERRISLHYPKDLDGDSISFSLRGWPAGIRQDPESPWVFIVPGTIALGLYNDLRILYNDGETGNIRKFTALTVLDTVSLTGWKLKQGKPEFRLGSSTNNVICPERATYNWRANGNRFSQGFRALWGYAIDFQRNDGPVWGTGRKQLGDRGIRCSVPLKEEMPLGSTNANVDVTINISKSNGVFSINSVLADGTYSYKFRIKLYGQDKGGKPNSWKTVNYYTTPNFNVIYMVSRQELIIPEVIRPVASAGHPLATISIGQDIPGALWEVEGTPAVPVNLRPVFGARNRQAVLELGADRAMDFESGADFLTVTISAVGRESATKVFQAWRRLVIKLKDEREVPVFPTDLINRGVIRGSGSNTFQLPAANDPSGNGVVYSAVEDGRQARPAGIGFDPNTRTFTVAASAALGTYTIRVRAQDRVVSADFSEQTFLLLVKNMAGILAIEGRQLPLSRLNPAGEIGVQLDIPPSKNVTLTLLSQDAADVAVSPLTLEFTPSNWHVQQPVMMELTPAGIANKRMRTLTVSIGVYSPSSSDSGYRASLPVSVAVQVDNPNASPVFVAGTRSRRLPEEMGKARTAANTPVGAAIAAADADNLPGELTYSLVGSSSVFKIVPASGQLQIAAPTNFNFEKVPRYLVTVQVQDNEPADLRQTARVTVTILVQNVPEQPGNYSSHMFMVTGKTRGKITVTWNNDEYSGSSAGQFDAEDLSSIVVSYGTSGFADALSLAPDATRATIAHLLPDTAYDITINWYSADNLGSRATVTIGNVRTNANAVPAFTGSLFYTRPENAGAEKTAAGTAVATVAATDADMDDIVNYSIRTGADSALLAIGEANGVIRLSREVNLNHEVRDTYTVTVQAEDNFGSFVTRAATVSITGINEAPEFPEQKSVQTATAGTESTITLTAATDPENDGLQYQASLGSGADLPDWLRLDSATGQFTVDAAAAAGLYQIRAKAVETGNSPNLESAERSFTLVVMASGSANSPPNLDRADLDHALDENTGDEKTAAGTAIGQIVANDDNVTDVLLYSLTGTDAAPFQIDEISGQITLKEDTAFDHENQDLYVFMVVVNDGNGGLVSGNVTVSINNLNEAPEIAAIASQLVIKGVAKTFVLPAATDPEGDSLVYTASSPGGWLTFTPASRVFEVAAGAPLGTHVVTLTATETGNSPNLSSERPFVIRVQSSDNVNRSPVFPDRIRLELPENTGSSATAAGATVGVVMAADAENDSLTYAISGADAAPFGIDPASGTITVATETAFDREFKDSYVFTATADDGNGGIGLGEVMVAIVDVNEPPTLAQAAAQQLTRGAVRTFTVSMAVDPEGDRLVHTATAPGGWLTFTPVPATRVVVFNVAADAPLGEYAITLTATETGRSPNLSVEMTFALRVQASPGENATPVFSGATDFELPESAGAETPAGTLVGVVTASDAEGDAIAYSVVASEDAAPFGIGATGRIMVTVATRFEASVKASYVFAVLASDGNSAGRAQISVRIVPIARVSEEEKDHLSINAIDRAIAVATGDIIAARLDSVLFTGGMVAGSGAAENLAGKQPPSMRMRPIEDQWSSWGSAEEGAAAGFTRMDWNDFLYSRGFDLALSNDRHQQAAPRLWGLGSRISLDGRPTVSGIVIPYEGRANVVMFGVEAYVGEAKVGLAAGQSKAEFTVGEEQAKVDRRLHSIHPYVSWEAFEKTRAWLAAGIGTGDYIRREGGQEEQIRDAEYMSVTGGLRRQWQYGDFELGVGGKAMGGKSVLERTAALAESKSDDWRLEVDFRAGLPVELPERGLSINSFLGGNLRRDGGDGIKTNEMDIETGVQADWAGGFSASLSGRWQTTTNRKATERRLTGTFSYDAGGDGRGLMVSMEPSLAAGRTGSGGLDSHRALETSIGYGLPLRLFADHGVLLLNAQVDYADVEAVAAYGFSFAGRRLQVDLSAAGASYRLNLRIQ